MIKTVIFDMDGLLFDTENLTSEAWIRIGEQKGYPITMEFMNRMRGLKLNDCARMFSETFGDSFDYWALREERIRYVEEKIDTEGVPVKKGARELLEWLTNHQCTAALATSTHQKTALRYLEKSGLRPYFSYMIYGDMVEHGKPDPEIFLKAAECAGTPPQHCLVLEDSYAGIEAGYRAGCSVIMVPDTLPMTMKEATKIRTCCDSLLDVIPFLCVENGIS